MALSANKQRPHKGYEPDKALQLPVTGVTNHPTSAAFTIYKGAVLISDVSAADGYVHHMPSSGTTAAASGDVFAGIALDKVIVATADTTDGTHEVSVATTGIWGFPIGSLAITDLGAAIYASDDDTVTSTSTNNLWIGSLVDVDSTYAWVNIEHAAGRTNSAT